MTGASIIKIHNVLLNFKAMIRQEKFDEEKINDLICFQKVSQSPSRIPCVTLIVYIIEKFLDSLK
jgi:NifU-like protein involved in Fe-S cluster formation